jgi:glutamate synthase domain-containing protein 3
VNKGANLWVLGFKSEWDKIKFNTIEKGKTEILGGFIYALNRVKTTPMFRVENSMVSLSGIRQTNFTKPQKFYTEIVEEIRNDSAKILLREQTHSDALVLFSGYK